jgi:DNA ligase D
VSQVADDAVTLTLDGRDVRVTSPDKVFFTKRGETKLDLVEYYVAVAEPLLRTMRDRPVLLQRFPDGASGKSFFQKRVPKGTPDWLHTTVVSTPNGTTSNALVAADIAHVAWAVNLGCLGFHVWPYHWDDPNHTDELRIDLDPQPGVVFDQVREAAYTVKTLCDDLGVTPYVKTSGSKGLHIYIRLLLRWNSFDVRAAAVSLARELERRHPALVTAAWWKEERGTRVFVDFNQNAPHKTVFGAWSVRPRVGGQVSMPIAWDEVGTVQPEDLTIATVPAIVEQRGDAWATMNDQPQSLEPLLDLVRADVQRGLMDAPWPPVYPKQPNEPPRVAPSRAKRA